MAAAAAAAAAAGSPSIMIPSEANKQVKIVVLEGRDLKGVKGDSPNTFVRAEFNGVVLGDSPKAEATVDGSAKYNFTTSFECNPEGPHYLDDIAHKPFLFTVIEVLPKEKKQKEEKTVVLGQAVLDLLPLLQGSCAFHASLPLHSIPGSPLENLRPDAKCGIDVAVSVQESLLSPVQLAEGNLLTVTLEAAYSVPEAFVPTGPLQNYMVGLQVPAVAERECPFMFKNGILKLGGEREPLPRPKKWPFGNILAPGAQNIPESFIVGGDYEEEDGELNTPEERDVRLQGESIKKRIMWDFERRCYIDPVAVGCFRKRIADCRCWPVEITRVPLVASTKGKGGKADKGGGGGDDEPISFHGVAYVNLVPLLYPGVKRIRGAFKVVAYHDSEVYEKTKCLFSLFRDVGHQAILNRLAPVGMYTPHTKGILGKNMKDEKPVKEAARKVSTVVRQQISEIAVEAAMSVFQNLEGQQYSEAGTFIVIEFVLDKALVPKRLPEELAARVKEMIPSHPQLPRRTAGAKKAVEDYHRQITIIAESVLEEYHELFGRQLAEGFVIDKETMEEQKCQLNYELNNSGKYFAFKEQLKHTVVKIVREKYLKTTAFDNLDQLQAFLSELYVYLVDQMHVALNQVLCQQSPSPPLPSFTTSEQLLLFAREAELSGDYTLASTYYKERLSRDRHDIQSWIDYGAFCLLTDDTLKAQECFREAVALDPNHVPSLLLCGIMAVMLEHYEEAEVFFEDATCLEPSNILAWTILGLFYDIQENDIRVEMAFHEATKLQKARLAKEKPPSGGSDVGTRKVGSPTTSVMFSSVVLGEEEEPVKTSFPSSDPETASTVTLQPTTSIYMEAINFLMDVNALQFVHTALSHELLCTGTSCNYYLVLAQTYMLKKDYGHAESCLEMANQIDFLNPNVWAQKGHLCYLMENFTQAKECFERTVSFVTDAKDIHFVYLRLGSIYLEGKEYEKAKITYLSACRKTPSCLTWLGVGIACYRLQEMAEAEDALSEANALNNNNAEVWAYLALVCMHGGRQLEAEQSYKYAIKLALANQDLIQEIKDVQLAVGFGDPSF